MKRIFSAFLCGICTIGLLSGCGNASGEDSKEVCIKQTSADGSYITYDYDADGNQIKSTNYSADDTLLGWTEYIFDKEGLKTQELAYDADGDIQTRSEIQYDGERMTSLTCYDGEDKQQYQETYEYDENGHLTKECYTADTMSYSYDIEMDEDGNEIKRTMLDGSDLPETVIVFDYNADDLLIKSTTYEDAAMETPESWTEYDYNADGNLIRQTSYNTAAQVDTVWEYSYNENGNVIAATINGTGSAEPLYTYEYISLKEYLN